jgi:hydroxymethylglutaryl-CoA synthase
MKPIREVGIVGYGAYIPRYRLPASEVARVWKEGNEATPVTEKSVAGPDEDTITISLEAGRNALRRARIDPAQIGAVWVGSESHPYAVKPTSSIVAEAIGATPELLAADWEFACKGGSETMQAGFGLVGSGMAHYVLSIGADTAQCRPGDDLEYTAAAGGAAFVIGAREESLAYLEASYSYVTDTPDFFRRADERFPQHGSRFTGEPAYFTHVLASARALLDQLGAKPSDYRMAVFHQPNVKFPQRAGKVLGFTTGQVETGLLADRIGNTYAGASLLGVTAMLDVAEPGDRLLLVSFGSGAGSDAMSFVVTEAIRERRGLAPRTREYLERRKEIDYAVYTRYREKLRMR